MDKLKINLIPPEIKEKAKKAAKRSLVVRISVGLLGLLIIFTSGLLSLIIFQSVTINNLSREIEQEKTRISSLKDKETAVFFLKNRLESISKFSDSHYKQGETYDLLGSLFPSGANFTSLQLDKSEKVVIAGDTDMTSSLDTLFNNLTDPKTSEGKISSVSVESLNRAQTGKIRFSLNIIMRDKLTR